MKFGYLKIALLLIVAGVLGLLAAAFKPIAPFVSRILEPWALDIEAATVAYAAANTKATGVTNADATPPVRTHVLVSQGRLHESVGTVEIAAADDAASVYRVARVHSSWRIAEIKRFNDAITSGSAFDCGVYDIAANGGAAVDADLFGTDITLVSASVTGVEETFEALNIDKIEKPLWEALGLSTDPGKWYDLAYTGDTPGSGAGTLSVRVRYVQND